MDVLGLHRNNGDGSILMSQFLSTYKEIGHLLRYQITLVKATLLPGFYAKSQILVFASQKIGVQAFRQPRG